MEFSFLQRSIVNDSKNAEDFNSPYSFLSFIQYSNFLKSDVNQQLKDYQSYINNWSKRKNMNSNQELTLVRDSYISLLREITLNFSSEEERRFIINADFTDDSDLDIIIPFFIQKLKQISFYYNEKRQEVKNSLIKYNLKGSNFGIENVIRKIIYEYIDENYRNEASNLSAFYNNFDISIDENYSDSDTLYDKPENNDSTYSVKIDPEIFINIKQSIINSISAYPSFVETLDADSDNILNSFTYNKVLSGDELYLLKERDFINYFNNNDDKNLKINLLKSLYPKFIGNDFYYLSTNSENKSISGILFESENFNGQFLNKNFPTIITTQPLSSLYTTYELGGFFTPKNQGILLFNAPQKTYEIDKDSLDPDNVYIFPDPNVVGNVINTSGKENRNIPLVYNIKNEWNKVKSSNSFRINDVITNNYNNLFYAYQSKQQNIKISTDGISKVTDNITFWNGEKDQIWKGSFDVNKYPIDKDKESLLLNEGVVVEWYPDHYNNEFALYKKINSFSKENSIENEYSLIDGGPINGSDTILENRELTYSSLYEKKNTDKGKIYVRNNFYNNVNNIVFSLSSIFSKYPKYVTSEVENESIKLFVIDNIFVIETTNYVVSDTYSYNLNDNTFTSSSNSTFYLKKKESNTNFLDSFVNPWYDEKNKKLFLVFLKTLENSLSASNYKYISPVIYSTDIGNFKYKKIYPLNSTYTNVYSLSTPFGNNPEINIVEYCGGSFTKNSFLNEFNFTYMGKNLNSIPFIINEKLSYSRENETLTTNGPLLLKPFYYYLDNNYANPEIQYYVKGTSNRSGYLGGRDSDSLNIVEVKNNKINYAFSSNTDILQINQIGTYVVHFDWESYNETNIFIGCSSIRVKEIENNLIIDFNNIFTFLTGYNEEKEIFNFDVDGITFNLKIKRPIYPETDILHFNVYSNDVDSFSGKFCEETIYRKLTIVKNGGGVGEVVSDPPCISCGDSCQFLYPANSTVTLVASASINSEFAGWYGDSSECYGSKNDCLLKMDDDKTIVATFDPLPLYKVFVLNSMGNITSLDGKIKIEGDGSDEALYYLRNYVTLSASPPPKDFRFRRFSGAPCYSGERMCTFIVYSDMFIEALYSKIIYFDLDIIVKSEVDVLPLLIINTIAGERELQTNDTNGSLLITPEPRGKINWEIYEEPIVTTFGTDYRSLSENTVVSLTAEPYNDRYYFDRWISGPCKNSTESTCRFSLYDDSEVIAYFALVRHTVTIIISGGGLPKVFSIPSGINCDPNIVDPVCEYAFVSGINVTVNAVDVGGSTFLGFESYEIPSTSSTTTTFKLDRDITLTAIYVPFDLESLKLFKYGDNKVIFSTLPSSKLYSDLTTTSAEDTFPLGTNVEFVTNHISDSRILYYKTSIPITNRYVSGNGISLGSPSVDIKTGENGLILTNNSLIINDISHGAPFAESEYNGSSNGILITYTSFSNIMTTAMEVSAFIKGDLPPVISQTPTRTPTRTPTPTPSSTFKPTPTRTPTPTPTPTKNTLGVVNFNREQVKTYGNDDIFPF